MLRPLLVRLHRCFGLGAAAFLAVAGLTGALISWDRELDGWLNPRFYTAPHAGAPALDALVLARRVEAADPRVRVSYLPLAAPPGETLLMRVEPRIDPSTRRPYRPGYNQVAVDPATGEVLARREWGAVALTRENLLPFLYKLHYSLQIPDAFGLDLGVLFMGALAVGWTVDTLLALWIAFPSRRSWRRSFAFRWREGGFRLVFDLHRSGGVWAHALVLVLAVTSVAMNLREELVRPAVAWFSPLSPSPFASRTPVAAEDAPAPRIGPAEAIARAQARARALGIAQPAGGLWYSPEFRLWGVGFFAPGEERAGAGLGNPWLYLDAASGAAIGEDVPGRGSWGDLVLQGMYPLHSGRIAGLAGRIVVSASGVLVAVLCVTGVALWARRRRARAGRPLAPPAGIEPASSA